MKKIFSTMFVFVAELVLSGAFALIGAWLGSSIGERYPAIKSWELDVTFGLVFFILGYISVALALSQKLLFRQTNNSIEKTSLELRGYVGEKIVRASLLQQGHIAARYAIQQLFDKRAHHFITEGARITILEYLYLLEDSLMFCTEEFFATSLLTPQQWLDSQNQNSSQYQRYLEELSKKKKQVSKMEATRVFISRDEDFRLDNKFTKKLIKLHKKAGVRIGHCSIANLIEERLIRDFVYFRDGRGAWVVDSGQALTRNGQLMDETRDYPVRVYDEQGYLNTNYSDIRRELDAHTSWF